MRIIASILILILALASGISSAKEIRLVFEEVTKSELVKIALLEHPDIKFYWGTKPDADFVESSRKDTFSGTGHGSKWVFGLHDFENCQEAFSEVTRNIAEHAASQGFDSVFIQSTSGESDAMICEPGFHYTQVYLDATMALTREGKARLDAAAMSKQISPREPAKGAVFMPVAPILASAEFQKLLGPNRKIFWGRTNSPVISERFGPENYTDYGYPKPDSTEASSCTEAFMKSIEQIISYGDEYGHDNIVRTHSFLNDQDAPDGATFECLPGRRYATVTLRAATAKAR